MLMKKRVTEALRSIPAMILLILIPAMIWIPQPADAGLGNWVKSKTAGPPIETIVPVQLRGDHWCAYLQNGNYVKVYFATGTVKRKAAKFKAPLGDSFLLWGRLDQEKPWLYHAESLRRDRGGDSRRGLTGTYSLDADCQSAAVTPGYKAFGASVAPAPPSGRRPPSLWTGGAPQGNACQAQLDWTCLSLELFDDEGIATVLGTLRRIGACK